jgi:hypothetical protein
MTHRRFALTAVLAIAALFAGPTTSALASPAPVQLPRPSALTNLAHLDFLTSTVLPPAQAGHTTYRISQEPAIGVLWVYANHLPDGSYQRTGGGAYDPSTNTYGQGSYDADDISRAAVAYIRHWTANRDRHSRNEAYQLLRGLTYLQTVSGPNAGNVVLWMQPDGTLNPSPAPKDSPDPSDSSDSYWLARTIWALGEGYAAFRAIDPAFAQFLQQRLELAIAAVDREVLTRYGEYQIVDGVRTPAWLIVDGADASAEAILGLSAYVRAGGSVAARDALAQLADGIAAMGHGDAETWPYGAILPWALSISDWHAWAAQMPTALAEAAATLRAPRLLRPAIADTAVFTPRLLTATGPDNGGLPTPGDGTQIAYGADARVQALLAVSSAAHSAGLRALAGFAAGWFFGQNPAGVAMYDPATGVTHDGVSPDGTVNLNSGAESTIHGLLTMQALDANPDLVAIARASSQLLRRDGLRTIEAEAGLLSGSADVVAANPAWTGESLWSGGAYVQANTGSRVTWTVPAADQPRLLQAVINRVPGPGPVSRFTTPGVDLGLIEYGHGGPQGASPAPGALLPVTVARTLPSTATTLSATTRGGSGQLDAIQLTPLLSSLLTSGGGHAAALLSSASDTVRTITISLPGTGRTVASSYDTRGRLWRTAIGTARVTIAVPPGGFAIVMR